MRRIVINDPRTVPWVRARSGGQVTGLESSIAVEVDGELQAGVIYDDFTHSNISMHCRIDSPVAPIRQWYWMAFDYPFNQLGVSRCTSVVKSSNERSLHLQDRLGFRLEATLADYYPDGDAKIFVMRKEDCRFLGGRYAI